MRDKERRIREMEWPEYVKFRTYNIVNSRGKIIMARIKRVDDDGIITGNLGFAFCSPKDSFWRKKGKFIASERLLARSIPFRGYDRESVLDAMFQEANRLHVLWMKNVTKDMVR